MWLMFGLCSLLCTAMLFLPGFFISRILNFHPTFAICIAPLVSYALYAIAGMIFGLAGIPVSGFALAIGIPAISFVIYIVLKRHTHDENSPRIAPGLLALYLIVGAVVTLYYYVLPLDGPDSFVQFFDNAHHINLIEAFAESNRYSIVQSTKIPADQLTPFSDLVFYPAGWHVISAICSNSLNVSSSLAANATNAVILCVVFPLGICSFLSELFNKNQALAYYGLPFVFAFAAFPWGFLVAGPLYSNFASLTILPAFIAVFITLFSQTRSGIIRTLVVLLFGFVSLAVTQTNCLFSAMVILAPLCVVNIFDYFSLHHSRKHAYTACTAFVLACALFWLICRKLSIFAGVIGQKWTPYVPDVHQGIMDFLDLGFRNATSQILLAAFVILGIVYLLYSKSQRWILAPYLFFFVAYIIPASCTPESVFGSLLSGFWYNDVDRIAANAVILFIPLASIGLYSIIELIKRIFTTINARGNARVIAAAIIVVVASIIYCPTFILAGRGTIVTALGSRHDRLVELNSSIQSLTDEEIDFLKDCRELVGDELVINCPIDGSAFAYSQSGLNTLYRSFFHDSNYKVFELSLDEIGSNRSVSDLAEQINAQYILVLDLEGSDNRTLSEDHVDQDDWSGMLSVDDSTPGLEVVLSEDDMRLYRIL